MTRIEKIALLLAGAAAVVMYLMDRSRVQSGINPLLAEQTAANENLGSMVVGESGAGQNPSGAAYIGRNMIWGWPMPTMLPVASGG